MKRIVLRLLKFAIPIAIIGWLLSSVPPEQFQQLRDRPKNWKLLFGALILAFSAVSLTFVRWCLLVRALRLRFRLIDAFRLGFFGYLLNFVSAGAVGGDLFKAYFIAREQHGRRAEAVATVVVDRIIGLYALLLLTSTAILVGQVHLDPRTEVVAICRATLGATVVGGLGIAMLLVPGFTSGALSEMLNGLPKIGPTLGKLISAVRIYRARWKILLLATVMSMGTHFLFSVSLFLIATSLFDHVPTFGEHLILVPLGLVAGALPFAPGGFGALEFAVQELYRLIPADPQVDVAGVLVALVYRLITMLIAAVGVVVYWSSRAEVRRLMEDAEQDSDVTDKTGPG